MDVLTVILLFCQFTLLFLMCLGFYCRAALCIRKNKPCKYTVYKRAGLIAAILLCNFDSLVDGYLLRNCLII